MTAVRCARLGALALALGLVAAGGRAGEFRMDIALSDLTLGKRLLGPEVKADDLKHRVVLIDCWGINCPPCLALMPKLSAWHAELAGQGLVIVGVHSQNGTAEKIKATAQAHGATFTIVENAAWQKNPGHKFLPHCLLFDHEGKCIFRGDPKQAEPLLRRALARAPAPLLEGKKLTKLVALGQAVRKETNLGAVLKQAQARETSADAATAEEAKYLVEKITARGRRQLDEAAAGKETQPLQTVAILQKVSSSFKGTDLGKEAADRLAELKKDKDFQAELKVGPMLQRLKTLQGQLRPLPADPTDTRSKQYRALNGSVLNQMSTTIRQMRKTAPQARATQEAMEIAELYGLLPG